MMRKLLFPMILLLAVSHQDAWNWQRAEPLVFGFVPPGLAHHVGLSLAAALLWALAVRYCWPEHLEVHDEPADRPGEPPAPGAPS